MNRCPFWSTNKDNVNCYSTCPMYVGKNVNDMCPFKEFLAFDNKATLVDNMDEELFYLQDRYLSYNIDDKVINY